MDHRTTEPAKAVIGHPAAEDVAPPKAKKIIPTIDVNAILFQAANICRSTEELRYYLNGVYVQPLPNGGVLLVATDGHRLVCIHDETGSCSEASIVLVDPRGFAGVKVDRKKPEIPRLKLDAEGHVIVGTYRSIESAVIDGSFPDYARVLTPIVKALKLGTYAPASFNHEYLVSFGRIAALICDGKRAIRLIATDESSPALILFEGAPHAFGVLMPMRTSLQSGMPAFMRPVLDPPKLPTAPVKTKKAAKPKRKPSAKPKSPAKKKSRAKTRQ
jgi:hypothetical protein